MDSMEIEISVLNVIKLVDNVLDLKTINVLHAQISVMIWLMADAQGIYPVQLVSISMVNNVDNVQPIVRSVNLIQYAISVWMDLNLNVLNFLA